MRYQLLHNTFQSQNGAQVIARELVYHPAGRNGFGLNATTQIYLDVFINGQLYQATDYVWDGPTAYVAALPLTGDQESALQRLEDWFEPFLSNLGIEYNGQATYSQAIFESEDAFEIRFRIDDQYDMSDNVMPVVTLFSPHAASDTDAGLTALDTNSPDPIPDEPEEPTMTTPTYGAGLLSAVVTAAALRAQLDEQVGWHKSLSNVVVNGPTGMSQAITWDLEDPDTDAGYLNSHDVTTMIQHQGFRFWGNRNCSSDPRFAFEVATRTAQTVLETIVQGCFPFMDQPLTPQLAKDIIDSINAKLDAFVAAGVLIGARCWYDDAQNNSQDLSQGQLWVDYDYTPVPTLENLGLNQRITDRYLVDFAKLIAQAA
jgi:hypothetical protein